MADKAVKKLNKLPLLKSKYNDFMNRSEDMSEKELHQVVTFMLEIGNKNIDRAIEANKELLGFNKEMDEYASKLEDIICICQEFLEWKGLDKEFELFLCAFEDEEP